MLVYIIGCLKITIYGYVICLVYVCVYTPRSDFNIVYSCVHTLSHDYTTALTVYGYVCAHTPRKDFNIVYIHYHMIIHYHVSIHWVIANERAVLTSRDSQQPIRDHAPTWRRMGVYFTLDILLTSPSANAVPNPFAFKVCDDGKLIVLKSIR